MVSKAIAYYKGSTILIVDVLPLETGRSIEVERFDRIGSGPDVESGRKDELVPFERAFATGTDDTDRIGVKVGQTDDFGNATDRVQEYVVVRIATIGRPVPAEGCHVLQGLVYFSGLYVGLLGIRSCDLYFRHGLYFCQSVFPFDWRCGNIRNPVEFSAFLQQPTDCIVPEKVCLEQDVSLVNDKMVVLVWINP